MTQQFISDVISARLPAHSPSRNVIHEADLRRLPEAAQTYLRFMRVVGHPRDASFRLSLIGRFRPGFQPGFRNSWAHCQTWQYNTREPLARIFHLRSRLAAVVPLTARDTYLHGCGRNQSKLLDLISVSNHTGREYDAGELVSWLNDAILFAPSMLLMPSIFWAPVDSSQFDLAVEDHSRIVAARVTIDPGGAPLDFSTTDRVCPDPEAPEYLIRARWTTPVSAWQFVNGRPIPVSLQAIWHLPHGPFPYSEFHPVPETLAFNAVPEAPQPRLRSLVSRRTPA
jgi:hypothetical protein